MASLGITCIYSSPLSKEKKCDSGCRCVKKISIDVSLLLSLLTTSRNTIETTNINNIIDNNNMKDRNEDVRDGDENDKDGTDLASEEESKTVGANRLAPCGLRAPRG